MTDSIENIGLMIRNERLRKGLTQEELGKRIGVGKAQISKIESGKGLTIKTITKVLDALGMSASVILQNTQAIDKNVIVYIVAVINEFAKMYLANLHTSFLCNLIYPTFSRILLYSC